MDWQIYLSGEIHTDWRERIAQGIAEAGLDVALTGAGDRPRGERRLRASRSSATRTARSGRTTSARA